MFKNTNNLYKSLFVYLLSSLVLSPLALASTNWSMIGGNPGRTSWTPDEAPGQLKLSCIKPIEPFVQFDLQPIVANDKVYISTARGLYAFSINTCDEAWAQPFGTELPLGNSPTYDNGKLYVGGLDRKLYAIDANTGAKIWEFLAGAGFEANPLVVNNVIYIGNRDGNFYAISATNGQELWHFDTESQVLQSAAYNDNKVFFGDMNGVAYALNLDGTLAWSTPLPAMGWHSFWPVIYQDKVIWSRTEFVRNSNYDFTGDSSMVAEREYLFGPSPDESGTVAGQVLTQTQANSWIPQNSKYADLSVNPIRPGNTVVNYLENNFSSRNIYILNQSDGVENTFQLDDDNNDGLIDSNDIPDPAPFLTGSGDNNTSYPPVLSGYDGLLYMRNPVYQSGTFSGSMVQGWKYGTPLVSLALSSQSGTSPDWPMDEFVGMSAGNKYLHWNVIMGRNIGGVNLSKPNAVFPNFDKTRQYRYITKGQPGNANTQFPSGYYAETLKFLWYPGQTAPDSSLYFGHNYHAGPVVYGDKVVTTAGNGLAIFAPTGTRVLKTKASIPTTNIEQANVLKTSELLSRVNSEISKIVAKDQNNNYVFYKPGYAHVGNFDQHADAALGDKLLDYWSNPAENLYTMLLTLPYLQEPLKTEARNYIQALYATYPPYTYSHVGWVEGSFRQNFNWPYGVLTNNIQKATTSSYYNAMPPFNIYAMYKYAEAGFDTYENVYAQAKNKLPAQVHAFATDTFLKTYPHILNGYIAGYVGYINLAQNSGTTDNYTAYITERDRLLALRKNNFAMVPATNSITNTAVKLYYHTLNTGWNFMYLVPELANYLHDNILSTVTSAINIYSDKAAYPAAGTNNGPRAPLWFVAHNKAVQGENGITPYYQTAAIFQAKALVLKDSLTELRKYIDSPITSVGDLFYIQNLVLALGTPDTVVPTVSLTAPVNNATVSGNVELIANASDNDELLNVAFYQGTTLVSTDVSAPFGATWDSTQVTNGAYTLKAVATDVWGNVSTSEIVVNVDNFVPDTEAPVVAITSPETNTTVLGTLAVTANASDNVAVSSVQFRINGTDLGTAVTESPYTVDLDTTLYADGEYTLTAIALDTSNNATTSTDVIITIDNISE